MRRRSAPNLLVAVGYERIKGLRTRGQRRESRVRTSQRTKAMRLGLSDGVIVAVYFTAKGKDKTAVAVQQEKLPSVKAAARFKEDWSNRFDALASILKS